MSQPSLEEWRTGGRFVETPLGLHVFCRQAGEPTAAPAKTLLLLHGYPESSYSFHKVLDGLRQCFDRIVLFDFPGYGLSDKPTCGYAYSLFEQADAALAVWKQLEVTGGHLLAHDMGDSVATELAARHVGGTLPAFFEAGLHSLTFTNGSMVLELARLRIMQKLLLSPLGPILSRLSNYRTFCQQVRSAHGNDRLSEDDIRMLWENIRLQNGQRINHRIIRYLKDRRRFEKTRWLPSLAKVREPIHLCWGDADAVARIQMAHYLKEKVCPDAAFTRMPDVGHFCQLSDPKVWFASVLAFYRRI
jgi:pimeloyl-ACP methyl ester carboxylesterase